MRRLLTLSVFFLVASLAATTRDETVGQEKPHVDCLRCPDIRDRTWGQNEIRKERRSLVQALVKIVFSESGGQKNRAPGTAAWLSSKHLAIALLGELRGEEGIWVLMENLTYRVKPLAGGMVETLSVAGHYPAAQSLAKIGSPAVPAVLARLRRTEDSLERHLCVWTLIAIDGRDVARFRIEKAIEECRSYPPLKARLEAALEWFDKKDLGLAPPEGSDDAERE